MVSAVTSHVVTVKLPTLTTLPEEVVTVIGPLVLPLGTVATISVVEVTVKLALTPLNNTADGFMKFVPLMVTLLPTSPLDGPKPLIVGALLEAPPMVNDGEMLKKILPTPSTLTRPLVVGTPGIVTVCDPSLGVLLARTMGKVEPPSVDKLILTLAQLTGALFVLATVQLTVWDEPVVQPLAEVG